MSFTLIIDDIVYPNGRTLMGVLGGGGAQKPARTRLQAELCLCRPWCVGLGVKALLACEGSPVLLLACWSFLIN